MSMKLPPLIIVSGPPGAGKTRLARPLANRLGLPLFTKDSIKEQFADSLGDAATGLSPQLGLAAIQQLYATAHELLSHGHGLVVESSFHKGISESELSDIMTLARAVLVHVTADDEVLISRYERRATDGNRHPIHEDALRLAELRSNLSDGVTDMLELDCPSIIIDTTYGPVDPEEVAFMVNEELEDSDD